MSHVKRLPIWAVLASAAIIFSACAGAASPSPSSAPASAAAPSEAAGGSTAPSEAAYAGVSYPDTAIDCAKRPTGYTGEFSQIKAVDRLTVEFDLCQPDVSFLAKLAFATNGIQDSTWLDAHAADKSYVKTTNGTGPYMFKEWVQGDHITLDGQPELLGHEGHRPDADLQVERHRGPAPAGAPVRRRRRHRQRRAGRLRDRPGRLDPALVNRDAFSTLYLGFNVNDAPWDNEKVRQAIAMGIDRKRINDTFDPPGLGGRRLLHPLQRRRRRARATSGTPRTSRPPSRC